MKLLFFLFVMCFSATLLAQSEQEKLETTLGQAREVLSSHLLLLRTLNRVRVQPTGPIYFEFACTKMGAHAFFDPMYPGIIQVCPVYASMDDNERLQILLHELFHASGHRKAKSECEADKVPIKIMRDHRLPYMESFYCK